MRQTTLTLLVKEGEILLALKKRGFGMGKWNGYGGKPEQGESLIEAAVRETREEIGVEIDPDNLLHLGRLEFYFKGKTEWDQEVNIYMCEKWSKDPVETEEMAPKWFKISEIPFNQMWMEDKYWMFKFLDKQRFEGRFYYNHDGSAIEKYNILDIN